MMQLNFNVCRNYTFSLNVPPCLLSNYILEGMVKGHQIAHGPT